MSLVGHTPWWCRSPQALRTDRCVAEGVRSCIATCCACKTGWLAACPGCRRRPGVPGRAGAGPGRLDRRQQPRPCPHVLKSAWGGGGGARGGIPARPRRPAAGGAPGAGRACGVRGWRAPACHMHTMSLHSCGEPPVHPPAHPTASHAVSSIPDRWKTACSAPDCTLTGLPSHLRTAPLHIPHRSRLCPTWRPCWSWPPRPPAWRTSAALRAGCTPWRPTTLTSAPRARRARDRNLTHGKALAACLPVVCRCARCTRCVRTIASAVNEKNGMPSSQVTCWGLRVHAVFSAAPAGCAGAPPAAG